MFKISDFLIPGLVIVALSTVVLSERRADSTEPPGPVHVAVWVGWAGFEYDGFQAVVSDYNHSQSHTIVDLLSVSGNSQKTLVSASAGIPPEISLLGGPEMIQFADAGAIVPLDDAFKETGIREEDYVPGYWAVMKYEDHIYAWPSTPATIALHYNIEILKKAGFTKPPETISEMDKMIDKITVVKDGRMAMSGFIPGEPGWWNWSYPMFFGGRLWDGTGKITANEKENVRAMDWVQSVSKRFGATQMTAFKGGFGNFASPQNAFLDEKVAMEIQGVWMYNFIHKYNPTLPWAAAPFPYPDDRPDLKGHTIVDQDIFVLLKGCKHPKEAIQFMAYVQSQPVMEKLCLSHQKTTPLRKKTPEFWENHGNPYIKLFDEMGYSKQAFSAPKLPLWPEYQDELKNAFDDITLMTKTPQEALDTVQERMQPKLDVYLQRKRLRQVAGL
jgi:multiple sugar transport system substrate-binding protein